MTTGFNLPLYIQDWGLFWRWFRSGPMWGKLNNTGTVTVTANAATTTLTDDRIGPETVIGFMPTTAHAAAELATLYVTARGNGSCTLNHANNAQNDRTFDYSLHG